TTTTIAATATIAPTTTPVTSTSTGSTTTSLPVAPTTTLIPPPPGITFTFTNDPSTPEASVGDTVDYSYCGTNTSDVELEVLRVDDSRFGILEVPDAATIVRPGETLCNSDLGLPVTYTVPPADSGTTIVNDAVVTVRPVGVDAQSFEAADEAQVVVPAGVAPSSTTLSAVTPTTSETQ